jgi:filamentous hemagglutinin
MPSVYQTVFGGNPVAPAIPTYLALSFSVNTVLGWPLESNITSPAVAEWIDCTATAPALTLQLSDARQVSTGYTTIFNNVGANTFSVLDAQGNTLMAPASGAAWILVLSDNSTLQGTWRALQLGAGTSVANAAALAGAGLKAITTTLNEQILIVPQAVNYTIGSGTNQDRASCIEWTGGAGGTFSSSTAAALGTGWFCYIKNGGTGVVSFTPGSGQINGSASMTFNPNDSAIIVTDGTNFFSIGFGQSVASSFNFVTISLAGASGNVILTGAQLNRISYKFTGLLAGNTTVVVPASIQQYWVDNETTGAFTLTISAGGAGTTFTVPQATRVILYCDGLNIVSAITSGAVTFGDGTAASPSITFTSDGSTGLYRPGFHVLGFAAGGIAVGSVNGSGQWSIPAPTGGTALTVNQSGTTSALVVTGGTNPNLRATDGTIIQKLQVSTVGVVGTESNHETDIVTNNAARITVSNTGNVTVNAPSSGNSLTVNGVSGGSPIVVTPGAVGAPAVTFTTAGNTGLWSSAAANVDITTGGTNRVNINSSGNVTVNAPVSGNAITVSSASGANAITATPGTVGGVAYGFSTNGGTGLWSSSGSNVDVATASTNRININSTGNVTINAPNSGNALSVTQTSTSAGILLSGGTNPFLQVTGAGGIQTFIGAIDNSSGVFGTLTNVGLQIQTVNTTRITISNSGNVTVSAPSSGNALIVNGAANSDAASIRGSSTASQSLGLLVAAGTNSSDIALRVLNQASSVNYFQVRGDGVVFGNDGTSLFELGYKDAPLNTQSSNYTLVASDRGKTVQTGATCTYTLNTGVFSGGATVVLRAASGATLTVAQGGGFTLSWAGNGATTGNRTLTGEGIATLLYTSGSSATISGAGLT